MPIYRVQAPDGRVMRIEGPEGATPEAVQAAAAQMYAAMSAPPQRDKPIDPTATMSSGEKFAAGLGKMMVDTTRSVGQGARGMLAAADWMNQGRGTKLADSLGLPTQADIDEAAKRDKPLMDTGWGMSGNMAGQVGAAFIPFTGQMKAAKTADALWKAGGVSGVAKALGLAGLTGAGQTVVMNPRTSDESLLGQAAQGAAFGAGGQVAGGLLGSGVQLGRNQLSGSKGTAGRVLSDAAEMTPERVAAAIRAGNRELVAGSKPTTAQAAMIPGISQVQRSVRTMAPNQLTEVEAAQNAARLNAVDALAPGARGRTSGEALKNLGDTAAAEAGAWRDMLKGQVRQKYDDAMSAGVALLPPSKQDALDAVHKFYGKATYDQAPGDLRKLLASLDSGKPLTLKEFDVLRKQAGTRARELAQTDATAASAWGAVKRLFDDAETAAVAKSQRLAPTGTGSNGPIYGGLTGDADNAVAHLLRMQSGEVPGAFNHPQIGPIDLVWGEAGLSARAKGRGLAKIKEWHSEMLDDLNGRLQAMHVHQQHPDSIHLRDDGSQRAAISTLWNDEPKTWLNSAYDKGAVRASEGSLPGSQIAVEPNPIPSTRPDGLLSMPDIEASFRAFDDSIKPAPRDPSQYTGGLLGAVLPEQAAPLKAGRQLHAEVQGRFNTGPLSYAWRTGADGLPQAQGAELGARLVHSGKTQAEDLAAMKRAVLERGPTMRAAKDYAITDLIERSTQRGADADVAKLLPGQLGAWMDNRGGMLRGLLDGGELGTLNNVRADLNRAARAETLGAGAGSNTADKLGGLGLLDSPWIDRGINFLPMLGAKDAVRAGLGAMRESGRKTAAKEVAGALVDPEVALRSLQAYGLLQAPNALQRQMYLGPLLGAPILSATQNN
jgi:hypothetical protein